VESVNLQLSQRLETLGDASRKISETLRSFDRYPQGFNFIYESSINDNLDSSHTLIHKLNVPQDTWIMDAVKVWIYGEKYRAYAKGAASGGGSLETSEATIMSPVTGGPSTPNTQAGAGNQVTTGGPSSTTTSSTSHSHKFLAPNGTWWPIVYQSGLTYLVDDSGAASATVSTGETVLHTHDIQHTHNVPGSSHSHGMDHTHQIPGSSHSHQIGPFPSHTHDLDFGIYEAPTATANISLKIVDPDNQETNLGTIGTGTFSKEDWDLTQYFTKKGNYQLVFSADAAARIRSMVFMQPFIQPEGEA